MDRARAAQRTTATELGAGHTEDVAHHPQHRRVVVDIDAVCLPIDCDGERHDGLSLSDNDTRNADGSDQKGEGESIGRWYRSVRRCQSARQSCCTRSPATTPRYDGRSPAEWRIVARWRHG